MHELILCNQGLIRIENLHDSLIYFNCQGNVVTKIENLPNSLIYFICANNNITKIENLPDSLSHFNCSYNNITKIENLPDTLYYLDCMNINITKIENLPKYLKYFRYIYRPITHVDNLLINHYLFNNEFNLEIYNLIKKLQRRIRRRHIKKSNAITLIQKHCHNWLWKPVNTKNINLQCIHLRIMYNEYQKINFNHVLNELLTIFNS